MQIHIVTLTLQADANLIDRSANLNYGKELCSHTNLYVIEKYMNGLKSTKNVTKEGPTANEF